MKYSKENLHTIEKTYAGAETLEAEFICGLVSDLREMQHDAENPNYLYAGSRINRQALICRDNEIDKLRLRIKELEAKVGG